MLDTDTKLQKIAADLQAKFGCHTLILYGSRARGEATETSDYDLIALRDSGEMERDARIFEGSYLDVWIYPESKTQVVDESLLQILRGKVLFQKEKMGDELLAKVEEIYKAGPKPLPAWDIQLRRAWVAKMLDRANASDIEADYRRHWLLFDLLENYFHLRNRWYLGPKESFKLLKKESPDAYEVFQQSLRPNASFEAIEKLARLVTTEAT